jgi:hypothetical protein
MSSFFPFSSADLVLQNILQCLNHDKEQWRVGVFKYMDVLYVASFECIGVVLKISRNSDAIGKSINLGLVIMAYLKTDDVVYL